MVHRVQRTCLKRIGRINAESSSVSPLRKTTTITVKRRGPGCEIPAARRSRDSTWRASALTGDRHLPFRANRLAVLDRPIAPQPSVPSKQTQLFTLAFWRPEKIVAQGNASPGEAKSCRRRLEPAPDHPGIGARARHAGAEARIVKLALPHRAHQGQHVFKLVWIMRAQPFGKKFADFERQPQKDITGLARSRGLHAGKD